MKVIDVLTKMANETLEDNFKFVYDDHVFKYKKRSKRILDKNNNDIGCSFKLERCLNDEIELIQNESKERRMAVNDSKEYLQGEKQGVEYALSLLLIDKESLERTLEDINKQLNNL